MTLIPQSTNDPVIIQSGDDPSEGPSFEPEIRAEAFTHEVVEGSLPEVFSSIEVPQGGHWTRTFLSFVGPGSLIAVGYMDPGNWSTDLAGGATYGYKLLFVILLSSLIAMFLQYLAIKLGFATGRDLAQCCRDYFTSKPLLYMLWFVSEVAICACDLAEVIGSAIALKLLFGLPIIAGVCITAVDVLLILFMQNKRFEWIERLVLALVSTITVCFIVQLVLSKPDTIGVLKGYVPSAEIFSNKDMLYVAIGIVGATVMPHNLFLHSSLVLTRVPSILLHTIEKLIRYMVFVEISQGQPRHAGCDHVLDVGLMLAAIAGALRQFGHPHRRGSCLLCGRLPRCRNGASSSTSYMFLGYLTSLCTSYATAGGSLHPPQSVAGRCGSGTVWSCPACVGPELHHHGHPGGPNCHGGIR
jgi:hypothetical protein